MHERIKFKLHTFEKFSHKNKFQFFDLIISNSDKNKLEQKGWNKLFITKTKTSKCRHYTLKIYMMDLQYYHLYKSPKCRPGYNFIVFLDNFDQKSGRCLLTNNQKKLYSFRCVKCNMLTFVDFDVAFSKDCILKIIDVNNKTLTDCY